MATLYARPTYPWPLLGLKGQLLGNVERCALDATTGELVSVELQTAWQKIDIEWTSIEYDDNRSPSS
jgi:hypothetical protein